MSFPYFCPLLVVVVLVLVSSAFAAGASFFSSSAATMFYIMFRSYALCTPKVWSSSKSRLCGVGPFDDESPTAR